MKLPNHQKPSPRRDYRPPKIAEWILGRFRPAGDAFSLLGDLGEEYVHRVETLGRGKARWWYRREILSSFPEFTLNFFLWSGVMFKNYLKTTWRILRRSKGFSFINITGLAVGMACSLTIALYIHHELNFDRFHKDSNRIYRVCSHIIQDEETYRGAWTSPPLAEALKEEFPEVEAVARYSPWSTTYLVRAGEKQFLEDRVRFADASFFDIFSFPFLAGDSKTALQDPLTIVITQSASARYFGKQNPVGKILHFSDTNRDFKVTGLIQNPPPQSHLQFDFLASLITSPNAQSRRWMEHNYFTYVRLHKQADPQALESKFPDFFNRHFGPQFQAETGKSLEDFLAKEGYYSSYILEPLKAIHLNKNITDNLSLKGSASDLFIFGTIAVFTLLIACINFMNLSTARFTHRSKEVGVRKVLGSSRKQLIGQFLTESVGLSLVAFALALLVILILLPSFARLTERQIRFVNLLDPAFLIPTICILFALGLFAGSYPAFFLSSFSPTRTIKGSVSVRGKRHLILRRGLVVLQFAITFFVCLGTLVVSRQLRFVQNRDLGFDKDHVVIIHRANALRPEGAAFKQSLFRHPVILSVSHSESLPGRHFNPTTHRLEGSLPTEVYRLMTMYADEDFSGLYGLELAEGRYFDPRIPTDATSAVVINEAAARVMGLTDPVGKRIHKEWGGAKPGEFVTIIGVLKDFHFASLHQEIQPMIIRPFMDRLWNYTSVKIRSDNIPRTLALIESEWKTLTGGQPFEYSFLDSDFDRLYGAEQRAGRIFGIFGFLALFVACLGLFGLLSFTVERRTKEIGIRKVLGASVPQITTLITREIFILVLIASVVSAPPAYFIMQKWLQNFAYRIPIGGILFLVTALFLMTAALMSVGFRAVKAAVANPSKSLKYE
ncbi:MAG: ABC transporter permease [Candidatus Aminicenantales bacterium]